MWAIGVSGTPISKDQWPVDTIEIKGTPAHYSVALGCGPVNHFQVDPALNFPNHNAGRIAVFRARNGVRKVESLPDFAAVPRGILRRGNISEPQPVKNSLDTDSRKIVSGPALRFRSQIDHAVDVARSQLLAAAVQFSKNSTD